MKIHNPYTSRNMIKNPADFFGRRCEIEEIFRHLQEGFQHTSIVGERRSGKSSLLWHISRPDVFRENLADSELPYIFAYFDFQSVATLTQETFFRLLAECLVEQLPKDYAPSMAGVENSQDYFRKVIKQAKNNYRLVICLDEFETVTGNEKFDKGFLQSLRSYGNAQDVAYITSSRRRLDDICRNTDHLQGSEFWNIFLAPTYLGELKPEEAKELITSPSGNVGINFTPSEIDNVIGLAGYHPFFLQIACFQLFEKKRLKENNEALTPLEYKNILDSFLMAATPHFATTWNRLSPLEKNVLATCEGGDSEGETKAVFTDLIKRGLISSQPTMRPFSQTFAQFIKENHSPDRGAVATSVVGQAAIPSRSLLGEPLTNAASSPAQSETSADWATLDIWINRNHEILVNLTGSYGYSQFCLNRAKTESQLISKFDSRVRNLVRNADWRAEKYQIGKDVFQYFEPTPEVSEAYTGGRAAKDDDERFLITFKCSEEMLNFPFEFINSLSSVEEGGQKHLVLTHPVRKSIVGLKTRNRPLSEHFYEDEKLKVLLVSSNVSGPFTIENKVFNLPEIPGAREEVEQIEALIREKQEDGKVRCIVDVKHDVTCEEMAEVLQEGKYDVIHYSGHAMYSETPENSSLFFRKKRQNNQVIIERLTTNRLNFLVERTRLKFFYLSCCQGAMVGTPEHLLNNDFLGITHALLVAGVPSVLAMRWPLTDEMAVLLAASFYRELFKGVGLEVALLRARRQLQSNRPNDHSWLSPVLVVQSP